jgi:hypothetical protein
MIRWSARRLWRNPKTKIAEIEFINEDIDDPDGIVLANPVIQTFREKRALQSIGTLDEALHPILRKSPENHNIEHVFTQVRRETGKE